MVHEQGDMIGKNVSRVFFCSQTVKNSNMDHLEDVGVSKLFVIYGFKESVMQK